MIHFRCCSRERTKAITVFLYPPVTHRANGWVSYVLQGWCYFPFLSLSLFSSLLLFPAPIPSCSSCTSTKLWCQLWWSPGSDMGLSPREMQGPGTGTFLLLLLLGDFSTEASEPCWGVRGAAEPFWVPPSSQVTPGDKGDICELHFHLCFVKPLQLLLFNQLLCLLLQLPSLSESPFCLWETQRER